MARTGRPTTYSQEIYDKALDYVDNYEVYGDAFPSVVGLCKALNRSKSTIYDWGNKNHPSYQPDFSDILKEINECQEQVVLNRAIRGDYNAAISKLVLGKHGYHDKADTTLSGPDGAPVEVDHKWEINIVG